MKPAGLGDLGLEALVRGVVPGVCSFAPGALGASGSDSFACGSGIRMHYTPEHCPVNGGFQLYFCGKSNMLQMGKMYLLRSLLKHGDPKWSPGK